MLVIKLKIMLLIEILVKLIYLTNLL